MGSAQAQAQVWGVQARNWADLMEKMSLPVYHVVLDKTNVGRGTRLLDIGCGTGTAAQLPRNWELKLPGWMPPKLNSSLPASASPAATFAAEKWKSYPMRMPPLTWSRGLALSSLHRTR